MYVQRLKPVRLLVDLSTTLMHLSSNAFKFSSNITIISALAAAAPAVAATFLSFVVLATTDLYLPIHAFKLSSDALSFPSKLGIKALGGTQSEIVCPNIWTWETSTYHFFAIESFLNNW
jgi:hypothetical protein